MKQNVEAELQNLKVWMDTHEVALSSYVPEQRVDHPILREVEVIANMIQSIKAGDVNAIELGCELVLDNNSIPFGLILKSKILAHLKSQARFINPDYRSRLSALVRLWFNSVVIPREVRELYRLVKQFEASYVNQAVSGIKRESEYAAKWMLYLKS